MAKGGLTKGKSHAEGGIPMKVKNTGQNIEVEGGEIIINKKSVADTKKHSFDGQQLTKCEIASKINEADGNGVKIDCESVEGKKYKFEKGGTIMSDKMQSILFDEKGERKIDDKSISELTKYINTLPQTKDKHFNKKTNRYSPSRRELHKKIINSFTDELICIQQDEPIAILMGGSPASGKSSFLRKYAPYLLKEELLRIDADEVRSMLPEYEGWNASQTHLETKDIVNTLLSDRTIGIPCEFDLIYDGTMNNTKSYKPLIQLLKELGYRIFVVYIDNVPYEVIKKRALERYKKSGRFVPMEVIDDFFEKGKKALNKIKSQVDGYMIVDGSNRDYRIIEQGGMQLPQERRYSVIGYPIEEHNKTENIDYTEFYDKGGEVSDLRDRLIDLGDNDFVEFEEKQTDNSISLFNTFKERLQDYHNEEVYTNDEKLFNKGGKIKIRDKENYNKFLKILGELKLDNTDDDDNRYEYGKNYEQFENRIIEVKKSDFSDFYAKGGGIKNQAEFNNYVEFEKDAEKFQENDYLFDEELFDKPERFEKELDEAIDNSFKLRKDYQEEKLKQVNMEVTNQKRKQAKAIINKLKKDFSKGGKTIMSRRIEFADKMAQYIAYQKDKTGRKSDSWYDKTEMKLKQQDFDKLYEQYKKLGGKQEIEDFAKGGRLDSHDIASQFMDYKYDGHDWWDGDSYKDELAEGRYLGAVQLVEFRQGKGDDIELISNLDDLDRDVIDEIMSGKRYAKGGTIQDLENNLKEDIFKLESKSKRNQKDNKNLKELYNKLDNLYDTETKRGHDKTEGKDDYKVIKTDYGLIYKHQKSGFAPRLKAETGMLVDTPIQDEPYQSPMQIMVKSFEQGGMITGNPIEKLIPYSQLQSLKEGEKEIERGVRDEPLFLDDLNEAYKLVPPIYGQDGKRMNAVAYFHYFAGGSDWYITEYNKDTNEAYGYVILNGDTQMSEFGYIDIAGLTGKMNVNIFKQPNIDQYFKPQTLNQIFQSKYPELVEGEVEIYQDEKEVEVIETSDYLNMDFKNPYERNIVIRNLIDEKGDSADNYSIDEKEFIQLYSGMGGLEKFGAKEGLLYEYYTPKDIVQKMWGLAFKHKLGTQKIETCLEPSVATGNFVGYAPENVKMIGYDIDKYAYSICNVLYGNDDKHEFYNSSFEKLFINNKNQSIKGNVEPFCDLVIGNPPYGKYSGLYAGMGEKKYTGAEDFIDYFIFRSLDVLKSGGLLVFIIGKLTQLGGKRFTDQISQNPNKCQMAIRNKSNLVDAYRLPVGVFDTTQVESEIIVLRKK